jgi:uncharacterized protein YjgD (DUF1641 family)
MAQPVPFRRFVPTDTRDDMTRKVEAAPTAHAEAVLSSFALLQQLHDSGTLDLLRGLVGQGDAVVNHVVDIISKPEMVATLRNLLALGTVLGKIDPEALHEAIQGRPAERGKRPPSLLAITRQLNTEEARLGLSAAVRLLTAFGGAIKRERTAADD